MLGLPEHDCGQLQGHLEHGQPLLLASGQSYTSKRKPQHLGEITGSQERATALPTPGDQQQHAQHAVDDLSGSGGSRGVFLSAAGPERVMDPAQEGLQQQALVEDGVPGGLRAASAGVSQPLD